MCFIWQSWGDHTHVAQAALLYVFLMLAIYVYSWYGEELSHQVKIIWFLLTDYSDCFLGFYY
jgi:hypothetical protein